MKNVIINLGLILGYASFNSIGALLIKNQINKLGPFHMKSFWGLTHQLAIFFANPIVIVAFIFIALSAISWIAALSKMDLTTAYPIATGLNFAVIIGMALLIMGEQLTAMKVCGIVLLIAGIITTSYS